MRSDLLEVRSRLMQQWADFLDEPSGEGVGNALPINAAAGCDNR
jgi:hypothetical protein